MRGSGLCRSRQAMGSPSQTSQFMGNVQRALAENGRPVINVPVAISGNWPLATLSAVL